MSKFSSIQELIAGCLQKDRIAQKELHRRFYGRLLAVTMRYANDMDDAKAILNAAFLKIFQELASYDSKREFLPWAQKITLHTSLDHVRKRMRYEKHLRNFTTFPIHQTRGWNEALNSLAEEDIYKYIQQLPVAMRTVFSLFEIEGFSHKEIADLLGISVGTSRSHLSEAKKKLRKMLSFFLELQKNAV